MSSISEESKPVKKDRGQYISHIDPHMVKKMPWWGYLLITIAPLLIGGSSGSFLGASAQSKSNARDIENIRKDLDKMSSVIDSQSTAIREQNKRLERLTVVIARTSDIDISTLVGDGK